jgi:hypothetical protein
MSELPLQPGLTRAEAQAKMGSPEASGEPHGTGIFAVEHAWDRWVLPDGHLLHVTYDGPDNVIGMIQVNDPPQPEPFGVELTVHADYYQFYVQDAQSSCDTAVLWDVPGADRGLAVGEGLVGITTKRYGDVPVRIELYATDPGFQWEGIDRISEAGLTITTQLLVGMPISAMTPVPEVPPGTYAVRSMAWGLDTVTSDWDGADNYIVQLWPTATEPRVVHLDKPA